MARRGGQRLRKRVRQQQWTAVRRLPRTSALLIVLGYPLVVAIGLGVAALFLALLGVWPPPPVSSPFGRGVVMGGMLIGACWWFREFAQVFALGAERDRKGAEGEEHTDRALRPLRRRGWQVLHDIEFPGEANVDHLLIGPGGVVAVESKYTTERLWVNHKAIGGSSHGWFITDAKRGLRLAERALAEAGHPDLPVEAALVFWGPGAPTVDGGHRTLQGVWVLEGRSERAWRAALVQRPVVLQRADIKAIKKDLKRRQAGARALASS